MAGKEVHLPLKLAERVRGVGPGGKVRIGIGYQPETLTEK